MLTQISMNHGVLLANIVVLATYNYQNAALEFFCERLIVRMLHACAVCLTPVTAIRTLALCPTDHTALRTSGAVSFYWFMVTYTSHVANVSGFVLHWERRSDRTEPRSASTPGQGI